VLINYYPFGTNIIFDDPVFTIGGNVDKVYIMGQNGDASYELTSPGSKVNIACFLDVTTASGGTSNSIEFNLTAGDAMWGMNLDIIQVNPDFDRVGW
jgi:hypothetical protein